MIAGYYCAGCGWLLWTDVWVDLPLCARFRPDLLYFLLCFPVFVSFTLLSIKQKEKNKNKIVTIISEVFTFPFSGVTPPESLTYTP